MMARPIMTMTTADNEGTPRCPHCLSEMWDAPTTLSRVMIGWPHSGFIHVGDDGYAHPGDYLEVDCPECHKPSAVSFSGNGTIRLIASRTYADNEYIASREAAS